MRILIQGKIFISNKAIYFYSYFNDQGLIFGKETKIKINYSEIKEIRKAKNAIFFPNSITITLVDDQQLFMTSFLSRDICYRLLIKQFKAMKITQGAFCDEFDTDPEESISSEIQSEVSRPSNRAPSSGKGIEKEKEKDKTNYETKSNRGSVK